MTEEARDALRVAIVGAGAAGLATAAALLRQAPGQVRIDIFDRRATPFGMIRTAVAPDHEEGRQVLERYEPLFDVPAVRFLGLVELGRDVHRDDLLTAYDAVVYATGAYADRLLDVPGENLPGVCSGRQFAEWYTGTPGARPFDLNGVTNAVIVGLGDVALDLARVLLKNPEDFRATEMPAEVIDQLAAHRVREVTVLVRRGPEDCQLKTRDLATLLELPGVAVRFDKAAVDVDVSGLSAKVQDAMPLWRAAAAREVHGAKARLKIRFWTRALELRGAGRLDGVRIERTTVDRSGRLVGAGQEDMIPAQLLLRATGSRGVPLGQVPFDVRTGRIPTVEHRVVDLGGEVQPGEYATGWVANGWVGGFGTQRRDGEAVAERLLADLRTHVSGLDAVLAARGVEPVGIDGWRRLDALEANLGEAQGRARVRLTDPDEVVRVARGD